MLSASPSSVFHIKFNIRIEKQISVPFQRLVNSYYQCRSSQLGSQILCPLILNTNLIKCESKIAYPQDSTWDHLDWQITVITTTLCLTANVESFIYPFINLGITLKTFHLPETVQVFSNPTPITQSSINLQYNKNQPSLAQPSTKSRRALNYATSPRKV